MIWLQPFIWGTIGGIFLEAVHWYGLRVNPLFPTYARKIKYWIITIIMIFFGGLISIIVSISMGPINPLNAFILGLFAPALPHKLAKFLPKIIVAGNDETDLHIVSLRDFLIS